MNNKEIDENFEKFEKQLDDGFQVYFNYVNNRYLVFKTTENCYTQKLITISEKNPQPRMSMITKKRLVEMFPFMEDVEFKITGDINFKD